MRLFIAIDLTKEIEEYCRYLQVKLDSDKVKYVPVQTVEDCRNQISAFLVYHDVNTIAKFVSTVNSKIESYDAGVIWLAIGDESEKELINKVGSLCSRFTKA